MTVKTLRDLFSGEPIKNPTLRELAAENPEHTLYEQSHLDLVSNMPGDGEHPYESTIRAAAQKVLARDYAAARRGHARAEEEPEEEEPQVVHPYSGKLF